MILKNKIWAFIPARSGSKAIKDKNIKKFCGYPLIYFTLKISKQIKMIDKIIFSTDSNERRTKCIIMTRKIHSSDFQQFRRFAIFQKFFKKETFRIRT